MRINTNGFSFLLLFLGLILMILPVEAAAQEIYHSERIWPVKQMAWSFYRPMDVAVGPDGFVYVADSENRCIKKFTPEGGLVTKWGHFGFQDPYGFVRPRGITVDKDNTVYIADNSANRVQKFTSKGDFIASSGSHIEGYGQIKPADVVVDGNGDLVLTDTGRHCIVKLTADFDFIFTFGERGAGRGQFETPNALTVDPVGNIYVADRYNHRVQKFDSQGNFLLQWGGHGMEDGKFEEPEGIAIGDDGNVYVSDTQHASIQVFDTEGNFITLWNSDHLLTSGVLSDPQGIGFDGNGNAYVASTWNNRVVKFASNGNAVTHWGSAGTGEGEFNNPSAVGIGNDGTIYVADFFNGRVQVFDTQGTFLALWDKDDVGDGRDFYPNSVAVDSQGDVYLSEWRYQRMLKFDSGGRLLKQWGQRGSDPGNFWNPGHLAVDSQDNVYVADVGNHRIQKFNSQGEFLTAFGENAIGGLMANGIAVDNAGFVYLGTNRVMKLSPEGTRIKSWGTINEGNCIAVDNNGHVYFSDPHNHSIKKYTDEGEFVTSMGEPGTERGGLGGPTGIGITPDGRIVVTEIGNNRVQVFAPGDSGPSTQKAIIVAGGGTFPGNNLWDATQLCANYAYRVLLQRGFDRESIYYLSEDTDLDLDNNGINDDVDGEATSTNLHYAITQWATDAEKLTVYMVDHGGDQTFRLNPAETLSAVDLDAWLDNYQQTAFSKLILVLDGCQTGSFIDQLTAPPSNGQRIVITSTDSGESAYFVSRGTISFSNYFWTHIFRGLDIKQAFNLAAEAIGQTTDFQHPQLDDNGNGNGNDPADGLLAQETFIGSGNLIQSGAPQVGSVSVPPVISGTSTATITASAVTDPDGIARVWAIIQPPQFHPDNAGNPVSGLPSVELTLVSEGSYQGMFHGFNIPGTYHLTIYAVDRKGNISVPKITSISVDRALRRKAIIIAGVVDNDPMGVAIVKNADLAYTALNFQGYGEDDIYYLGTAASSAGVDMDCTLENLRLAFENWIGDDTEDLVVYTIGSGLFGLYRMNGSEFLSATVLKTWLDGLRPKLNGACVVIYDACRADSFLATLTDPAFPQRILISGASGDRPAHFLSGGDISFSHYFWSRIVNGADLYDAFVFGKNAIWFATGGQTALLEANGNGVGNEKEDGLLCRGYRLGTGVMLAADEPLIGAISAEKTLNGEQSALIWARDVASTNTIERVWAVVSPPSTTNRVIDRPVLELPEVELHYDAVDDRYEGEYSAFGVQGSYDITVFARDIQGNISPPAATRVTQQLGSDPYEKDDTIDTAGVVVLNAVDAQTRNFHDSGDQDWATFFGIAGESYEIKLENLAANCDAVLGLYGPDSNTLITMRDDGISGENEQISWACTADGQYFVMVRQSDPVVFGADTWYDLRVFHPLGDIPGMLIGLIADSAGQGIGRAVLRSSLSQDTAISFDDGHYILNLPAGSYRVTASAPGYGETSHADIQILSRGAASQNFELLTFREIHGGNIDGDSHRSLADAVIVMQILAGYPAGASIRTDYATSFADVDGDGRIGLPEAWYVLKSLDNE